MQYRKRPVIIDAFQLTEEFFTGEHPNPLHPKDIRISYHPVTYEVTIETLEGVMTAKVGDYIITGVLGEIYPCRKDIFEMTYERVSPTILPCPSCGRVPEVSLYKTHNENKNGWYVHCYCAGSPCPPLHNDKNEAINLWNNMVK